jgi:hypothetical protein
MDEAHLRHSIESERHMKTHSERLRRGRREGGRRTESEARALKDVVCGNC